MPGTMESRCIGKVKENPVDRCEAYEDCVKGVCERLYWNDCDMECDALGYDLYYCTSTKCRDGDRKIDVSECEDNEGVCCCNVDASTTTISTSTTTTTL